MKKDSGMKSDPKSTVSSSDDLNQGFKTMLLLQGRTTGPTRRSTKGQWTAQEDETLRKAVQRFQGKNWKKIAESLNDRTDVQCLHRWQKVLNPELVKGPWTKEEDEELIRLVEEIGPKKWSTIAQRLTGRIGKQCRERWHNHLNPSISKEAWTQDEELMLIHAHRAYGNKWAELSKFLPGRTDNAIKNHWNSSVKKKLDAYVASGLLAQFQGFPGVIHTSQSTPTSSRTQQASEEDESIHNDVTEISECSQGSSFVRCSQSNSDMAKSMAVDTRDQDQPDDMANTVGNDDAQPPEDPSLACELDDIEFVEESYSHDWQPASNGMENPSSLRLRAESELNLPDNVVGINMAAQMLTSEDDLPPPDGISDQLLYQESNCQIPHEDTSNYESNVPYMDQEFLELGDDELNYLNDSTISHFLEDQVLDPSNQSVDENQVQNEERGLLSYEPPRIPSAVDVPFLSCDLAQNGGELQHEFSPLGIRQLMMSSNCFISPCRLWDSPSRDDSPEAVLKTAAKTFASTPSILKKRNRDLLSPLSDKRRAKQQLTSSSQTGDCGTFVQDKENLNPAAEIPQKDNGKSIIEKVQEPGGVLVEQNCCDDMSFCQDNLATKLYTPKGPHTRSSLISDTLLSPHTLSANRNKSTSRFAASSLPTENTIGTPSNGALADNYGIFGDTPFKKSLESPSAWTSPWSSFVPGPRVDTDITVEDIGYFMSPGERSYDALGLMKQLSEHTKDAYDNAREVLGNETPDSLLKKKFSEKGERSRKRSNIVSERRVLDFSECASPKKGEASAKASRGISFSSPSSSHLLKSFR